jgi:hypothetical protein
MWAMACQSVSGAQAFTRLWLDARERKSFDRLAFRQLGYGRVSAEWLWRGESLPTVSTEIYFLKLHCRDPKGDPVSRCDRARGQPKTRTTEMEPGHAQRFYVCFRGEIRAAPVCAAGLTSPEISALCRDLVACPLVGEVLQQRGPEGETMRRIGNGLANLLGGLLEMY